MPVEVDDMAAVVVPADLSPSAADRFSEDLERHLASRPPVMALDCSQLGQIASSHVGYLWQAHQLCAKAKITTALKNASPNLWRVLQLLDLAEFFSPAETVVVEPHICEFPATETGISRALDGFADYLKLLNVPEMMAFELRTLFYEVATNVRFHSHLKPSQAIKFRAQNTDNQIVMVFLDSGRKFDPTTASPELDLRKAAERGQKRGFGLVMMRRLADAISYRRLDDDRNELTVSKVWRT